MAFVESIAAGRAVVRADEREPDADRELLALGAANLAGGVFRALPAGGGLSQTAVNDGARTKLAGAVTAAVALLTLLFLTGVFADLPQATLGALVLVSALGLVALEPLRAIGRIRRPGYLLGLVTLVSVLVLGVLGGVLVGVLVSMGMLVHALDHPDIRVVERGEVLTLRLIGSLYFGNTQRVRRRILELVDAERPQVLLLDLTGMPNIDVTALSILPAFDRELAGRGVALWLVGFNERPLALLRRSPAHEGLHDRIHPDRETALQRLTVKVAARDHLARLAAGRDPAQEARDRARAGARGSRSRAAAGRIGAGADRGALARHAVVAQRVQAVGERDVDVAPGGGRRLDEGADLGGGEERPRRVGERRRVVDEDRLEDVARARGGSSATGTIASVRGEPGICDQFVMRPATRSCTCAWLTPGTGFARLVTRQTPLSAIGVRTSPDGSCAASSRLTMPALTIPRAVSAMPVCGAAADDREARGVGDRAARRSTPGRRRSAAWWSSR